MTDRKLRRKSVTVTFAGDDDVLQHIVDPNNKKDPKAKSRRKSFPQAKQAPIIEEISSESDDENLPVKKSI
ncbi:hypothetical protein MAR_021399, partial [Mya arenaria]